VISVGKLRDGGAAIGRGWSRPGAQAILAWEDPPVLWHVLREGEAVCRWATLRCVHGYALLGYDWR
jgi:hypothetical protein